MKIYQKITNAKKKHKKSLAVLIDPENETDLSLEKKVHYINSFPIDYIFVGGSLITRSVDNFLIKLRNLTPKKVILFPGSILQVSKHVDALLFLSLISSRNPEYLIGNQVISAPIIKSLGIEAISTGYILIENGTITSVEYMSNSKPIPRHKTDIVVATAIAGEMLGHKLLYLECGSGASEPIPVKMLEKVRNEVTIPILVGGGIKTTEQARALFSAGADILVLGTIFEREPEGIEKFAKLIS